MKGLIICAVVCFAAGVASQCNPTVSTASGTRAPGGQLCSGQLLFEDNFNMFDQSIWRHENTLSGGGNWEFQWYVNDRFNSYVMGGNLHLKPTFTADIFGEAFLTSGTVRIPLTECTDDRDWGCERTGNPNNIINPIRSAKITTINSFNFKFGTLEIRAKVPAGDWIWPALWLMPRHNVYGGWPNSGEIDLMEIRGNRALFNGATHVGNQQTGSTMHFGPAWNVNGWDLAHYTRNQNPAWSEAFHVYKFEWTPSYIRFFIDDVELGTVNAGTGFWDKGDFANRWTGGNPWYGASVMAPFDQEFYIIMNNAVGGTVFFSDSFTNGNGPKPWLNTSPTAMRDFWSQRSQWENTWNMNTDDSHLQVDYVRVWAL